MLPRKNRIPRKDFPSHTAKGFPNHQIRVLDVKNKFFTVVFYKNELNNEKISRVSIVVSKKTAKTAVGRNHLRRRFYDLVGLFLDKTEHPFTAVFYPKVESNKISQDVLKKEIEKGFKTAKLIK